MISPFRANPDGGVAQLAGDAVLDRCGRPMASLRISVTDRCNLRCGYCMPAEKYAWLPRKDLLDFDEIEHLARLFCSLGTRRIRLTGGEPLLRQDLPELIARLTRLPQLEDLGMTTNAILLADQAEALRAAGLPRLTVSLDTLRPERFHQLTRRDYFARVLDGLAAARQAGFERLKFNVVVMRGFNDDELEDFVRFALELDAEVRFIEYMDVGGATAWAPEKVVPGAEILARLEAAFGGITNLEREARGRAPARRFVLGNGAKIGVITSTSAPFCGACDRSRLTADGTWFQCLYAPAGTDLRRPLRAGFSEKQMGHLIGSSWRARLDRGAEVRLQDRARNPLVERSQLSANPHLEMHTRGG